MRCPNCSAHQIIDSEGQGETCTECDCWIPNPKLTQTRYNSRDKRTIRQNKRRAA